jgi:hypothetical protein
LHNSYKYDGLIDYSSLSFRLLQTMDDWQRLQTMDDMQRLKTMDDWQRLQTMDDWQRLQTMDDRQRLKTMDDWQRLQTMEGWQRLGQTHNLVFNDAHALLVLPLSEARIWIGDENSLKGDYKRVYNSIGKRLFKGILLFRNEEYG